jgi:hypothetical protein
VLFLCRHHQLQLWWPQQVRRKRKHHPTTQQAQLLRYSTAMARALQRQGRQQTLTAARGTAAAAASPAYCPVTDMLFGPAAHSRQQQQQQHVDTATGPGASSGRQAEDAAAADWVCCNRVLPDAEAATSTASG